MATFLAAVRLDVSTSRFEIRSPDFSDLEDSCDDFSSAMSTAERAVRARVEEEADRCGGSVAPPTKRSDLAGREEFRQCFVVTVEVDDGLVDDA